MAKANTRKAIVFVVEGQTDKDALEQILKRIYRNKSIEFVITSGDVTTQSDVTTQNVEDTLVGFVEKVLNYDKFRWSDVYQIVHLIDTDGCFVPDNCITQAEVPKYLYSVDGITCRDKEECIERNKQKREIVDFLLKQEKMHDVPYEMYYMSCNLDDALYGDKNLSLEEKIEKSIAFQDAFMGQETLFVRYLEAEAVNGVPASFLGSWKYIREGLHSVERHTNFHLFFKWNPFDLGM